MKYVIDSNCLRHPSLRTFLARSKSNIAILPDYSGMEAHKGDAVLGVFESMRILSEFPRQVHVLKDTQTVCGLSGQTKGLQRRLIDVPQSKRFATFCALLSEAKSGREELTSQIQERGATARAFLTGLEELAVGFAEAVLEDAREYTPSESAAIRSMGTYPSHLLWKLVTRTMDLSRRVFESHPAVARFPTAEELLNTYIFRNTLSHTLLGIDYAASGGVTRNAARLGNDLADTHFATYATFFDGLLSNDRRTKRIHALNLDILARCRRMME